MNMKRSKNQLQRIFVITSVGQAGKMAKSISCGCNKPQRPMIASFAINTFPVIVIFWKLSADIKEHN